MENTVDILLFGGQSNMQGQTESVPEYNPPVENALEYRFLSNSLIPLCHPVGEDVGEDLIKGAHLQNGSLVPDFCRAYTEKTGRNAIAVHVAKGATTVSQWQKGTDRYLAAAKKIGGAIEAAKTLGNIGKIYYMWLQGESDGIELTTKEKYMELLTALKNDLKADFGIDKFGIIKVGYFLSLCEGLTSEQQKTYTEADEAIMSAQEELVATDLDFVMLTRLCPYICKLPEYINPEAMGHYNNRAMELIGTDAANALALL